MGLTIEALIGPQCKHPHWIAVQWKERPVRNLLSLSLSVCVCTHVCLHVFLWFCSDNTLGYHCRLRKEYLASWDSDIMLLLQCTLHITAWWKKQEISVVQLPSSLPTGKGGCRGSVCGGHSLRLPKGPCGKCVSQTHTHSRWRAYFYTKVYTHTHTLRLSLWTQMTHTLWSIEGKECILCSLCVPNLEVLFKHTHTRTHTRTEFCLCTFI